ncbi:hypothetical protein [Zavarzinia sp. CC-PAN008]|uniref:hypothetical protein n=1 Tax=Zavarzinia sp. CC-PAN008 TaxID=3243332 RepID=UPI003F74641E
MARLTQADLSAELPAPLHADARRRVDSRTHLFTHSRAGRFAVSNGRDITFDPAPGHEAECLDAVLNAAPGLINILRGQVSLHAAAVASFAGALVLAGASGAGKSTLAAALARLGLVPLADDVSHLDDRSGSEMLWPLRSQPRLWPDAVQALGWTDRPSRRLHEAIEKRVFVPPALLSEAVPVAALCILVGNPGCARLLCTRLHGLAAIQALLEHVVCRRNMTILRREPVLMQRLGRLVSRAPVWRVSIPRDLRRLDEVAHALSRHFAIVP